MSLVESIRRKGHRVGLVGEMMSVDITLSPGSNPDTAKAWALKHEQELRRELVSEIQRVALLRDVFQDAKLKAVRGPDGNPVVGAVTVRVRVEEAG